MSNLNSATKVAFVYDNPKCCKVDGCNNIGILHKNGNYYLIKGYCKNHYYSFVKFGSPDSVENNKKESTERLANQKCKIDGCNGLGKIDKGKRCFVLGYCLSHYERYIRNGDANIIKSVHGENRSKNNLYTIYSGIKARCYNENNPSYENYGGRGIKMSSEWLNDFVQFEKDMGSRPSKKHSVERDNVNGDYTRNNCRWALVCEQAINTRSNNKFVGVSYNKRLKKFESYLEINKKRVFKSLFKTEQAAQVARIFAEIVHFGVPIKHL